MTNSIQITFLFILFLFQSSYAQKQWISFTNANLEIKALKAEGDFIWAGTAGGVVKWNINDGSYIKYTAEDGLAYNTVTAIEIDSEGNIWFGTGAGVSCFLKPDISEFIEPVTNFNLSQNYPNPFNTETTVKYTVIEKAIINLTIYNSTGQEINSLITNKLMRPGIYSTKWDGTNNFGIKVPSGVYFYTLRTNTGYTKTKKMTLVK